MLHIRTASITPFQPDCRNTRSPSSQIPLFTDKAPLKHPLRRSNQSPTNWSSIMVNVTIPRGVVAAGIIAGAVAGFSLGALVATPEGQPIFGIGSHNRIGTAQPIPAVSETPKAPATHPDYTVAPCELWADTSTPVLPPYTLQNVCMTDGGSLSTPLTSYDLQLGTK